MRLAPAWIDTWRDVLDWDISASTQFVESPSGLVGVVRYNPGAGEPLVLVPGLAGRCRLLEPLARELATTREVILFDLLADRLSGSANLQLSVAEEARDLAAVLHRLGLERPDLLAVSYGVAVALELAVEHPHQVGSLTLYGGEARYEAGLGGTIVRRVLERFPLPTNSAFLNQFFNLLHGGKPGSAALASFVVDSCWRTEQPVMLSRLRALEEFDVTNRLWRIDVPTLILAGSRDVIVPPDRQRELAQGILGAHLVGMEGAGHIGFLTHSRELHRQFVAFRSRVVEQVH
jgi:pimeloyl-ACP methyl ester carboxylesterase